MSQDIEIKHNGITVWWSLVDGTSISELRDGFQAIGRGDLLPEVQNEGQALKRAIAQNFPQQNKLVRPLKGVTGFAVVNESETILPSGQKKLTHEEELRIAISGGVVLSNPSDHCKLPSIEADFAREKQCVTAAKLGGVLVKACSQLSGIPLRPRGGMYWIPDSKAAEWEQIVNVVEQANARNNTSRMKTSTDKESLNAICDALVLEVEKKLGNMEESLHEDDLGKRGLRTKEKDAVALVDLVTEYEEILGQALSDLKDKAENVQSTATLALLQCL